MSSSILVSGISKVRQQHAVTTNSDWGSRTASQIAQLKGYYEEGILDKAQLKQAIDRIMSQADPAREVRASSNSHPETGVAETTVTQKALKTNYRRPASPTTGQTVR